MAQVTIFQTAPRPMPRWFPRADVILMKDTFSYMVGEEGLTRILQAYEAAEKKRKKSFDTLQDHFRE